MSECKSTRDESIVAPMQDAELRDRRGIRGNKTRVGHMFLYHANFKVEGVHGSP
jgi:hypothetical protein